MIETTALLAGIILGIVLAKLHSYLTTTVIIDAEAYYSNWYYADDIDLSKLKVKKSKQKKYV